MIRIIKKGKKKDLIIGSVASNFSECSNLVLYGYLRSAISINIPVINDASVDNRKAIEAATSSGGPPRCKGINSFTQLTLSGSPPSLCIVE